MQPIVKPGSQAEQVGRLILAVLLVLWLPALPFGTYLIYPFVILTTWFHEMGHGLTAIAMGQEFEQLEIFADGSGVAQSLYVADISSLQRAAIAAGGPIGPILAGSGLIMASAHQRLWRPVLLGTAAAIFLSVIVYVRSPVGYSVLPLVGASLALVAWRAPGGLMRFTLQFVGMLAALSMLSDMNYLFTEAAVIEGQQILSDTGQIEDALWLPHWVWACVIMLISAVMVGASLKYALSEDRLGIDGGRKPPRNVLQFKRPKR